MRVPVAFFHTRVWPAHQVMQHLGHRVYDLDPLHHMERGDVPDVMVLEKTEVSAQILADGCLDLAIRVPALVVTGKSDHGLIPDGLVRMLKHQLMPVVRPC